MKDRKIDLHHHYHGRRKAQEHNSCENHLHWHTLLFQNKRPPWAHTGAKLVSQASWLSICPQLLFCQAHCLPSCQLSPGIWLAICTFVRGLAEFLCSDVGLSNCIFKEMWPHPDSEARSLENDLNFTPLVKHNFIKELLTKHGTQFLMCAKKHIYNVNNLRSFVIF